MQNKKSYGSVLEMVKDISDPEFAKEFEKLLKANTVYVYTNYHGDMQVFSSLKLAKRFAQDNYVAKNNDSPILTWKINWRLGIWIHDEYNEFVRIDRKKIIKA